MTQITPTTGSRRDRRIDFWRGLCLIDMVLVHLVYQGMQFGHPLGAILGEYTRFAAGGFIFIAGLSLGAIYLPRVRDPQKRWGAYRSLWRRALLILAVHMVAEISFLLLYPLFGSGRMDNLGSMVADILLFRGGYDLLPFYVVMLAVAPLLLEILRRGGWWIVGLGSIATYHLGMIDPYVLAFPNQQAFFVPLWQTIFVAGLLGGAVLPWFDGRRLRWQLTAAVAASGAMVVIFLACYGQDLGLHIPLPLRFWKVPLSGGEILRYLAMILTLCLWTSIGWRWIGNRSFAPFIERFGRHSLAVYVAHVWVVAIAIHHAKLWETSGPINLLFVVGALVMLGILAYALDLRTDRRRADRPNLVWPVLRWPAAGVALTGLLFGLNALQPSWDIEVASTVTPSDVESLDPIETFAEPVENTADDAIDETPADVLDDSLAI